MKSGVERFQNHFEIKKNHVTELEICGKPNVRQKKSAR